MPLIQDRLPGVDLAHLSLGTAPTPVGPLADGLVQGAEVWVKDEGRFGDGAWGSNKVHKLEWILGEAHRRGTRTPSRSAGSAPTGAWPPRSTVASTGCGRCSAWWTSRSTTTSASSWHGWRRRVRTCTAIADTRRLKLAAPG